MTTARGIWSSARAPIVVGLVVLVAAVLVVFLGARSHAAPLDPRGTDDAGSHALATLLRDRGVAVARVTPTHVDALAAHAGSTIVVVQPRSLSPAALATLAQTPADLVLVEPGPTVLTKLGATDIQLSGAGPVRNRAPSCSLEAAVRAGSAETGGLSYQVVGSTPAATCYPAPGGASVVVSDRQRTVTVLGSPDILTNARLPHSGNAALALNLLGANPAVLWVIPGDLAAATGQQSLLDLLPHALVLAAVALLLATVVLALWRGRRLGPLVPEPLPVVVRAAETVEGRARLYQAARSRERAAGALRDATLRRLQPVLGLSGDAQAAAVVEAVASRSERAGAAVHTLLYGAAPVDDSAMVRLADELDSLETEVRRS